jgi:hypothetical protein
VGVLYETVIKHKRQYIIDELRKLNVTESSAGESLESLDYERLKEELVLASFRKIDVETDSNRWF